MKREHRRHLPHQIPEATPIFVTWNLKGAFSREVLEKLEHERRRLLKEPPRKGESIRDRSLRHGKLIFAKVDEFLDRASTGPLHLRNPDCAKIVEDSILFGAKDRYDLFAWCVMANHVHILIKPSGDLSDVMQSLKGYIAWKINKLQNQTGRTFWQDESYDHWSRDDEELLRIIEYIENNPLKSKLCERPRDWPWSSARRRERWPVGQPF